MASTDTNTDAMVASALGPKMVMTDAGKVESNSVADQIAAIKFAAGQGARKLNKLGLRFRKMVPPAMVTGVTRADAQEVDAF